jgi:glutathione S-transferase
VKIYTTRLSPYGNRIYFWAAAKDVSLDFVPPPGGAGSAEFKAINPSGKIPVLIEDDGLIPESMVILEYLEDLHPEPPLRLHDAALRAQTRAAAQIHDLYVMPEFNPVFAQFAQPKPDEAAIDGIFAAVAQRLPLIASVLPAGVYAAGRRLSLADCAMAPFFLLYDAVSANLGRDNPVRGHPRLGEWSAALLRDPKLEPAIASMRGAFSGFLARFGRG